MHTPITPADAIAALLLIPYLADWMAGWLPVNTKRVIARGEKKWDAK